MILERKKEIPTARHTFEGETYITTFETILEL